MAKKPTARNLEMDELNELLFSDGNIDTEGLLTFAKRTLVGDLQQKKISRVKELLKSLA